MASLKDALLKAGLKTTKNENERKRKLKKDLTKSEKHQYQRNYCEQCHGTYPDVEKFKHKIYHIDAQWMCVNCADLAEIHDDCRVTNQSEFSKQGKYIRRYGPTKVFEGQKDLRKAPRGPRPKKNFNEKKKTQKKYTIDENGEKNFNC
ncbi:MAG: hypothetical protein N4A33_04410 [Bacteriovoracaceae bacterium]|jgi:hypothetical protein|nr:hypothetical protein [Bacteriovoracaceae bacterium]